MAHERDSPDDLYPFAQALVRKLVNRHGLKWSFPIRKSPGSIIGGVNRQRHLFKLCRNHTPRTSVRRQEIRRKNQVAATISKALQGITLRMTRLLFNDNGPKGISIFVGPQALRRHM